MSTNAALHVEAGHDHIFLGDDHQANERKTWAVITLCAIMMLLEIVGGSTFGSLALVADGFHMATHVIAILIAALAYRFARKHADDRRFTFGTGKFGDLAGFASAIVLAMIALLVAYESVARLLSPVPIHFGAAILIAILGLGVNVASAWILSGTGHDHDHPRSSGGEIHTLVMPEADSAHHEVSSHAEPHEAHDHDHHTHRDHNFRSAFVHVLGDAAVSVLAILGLLAARYLGWLWMDPVMGLVGSTVIAAWAVSLVRDTTRVLVDVCPDSVLEGRIRQQIEAQGDRVVDLHLWRLGPGHLGTIVSIISSGTRDAVFYKRELARFGHLSHITIEVLAAREALGRTSI